MFAGATEGRQGSVWWGVTHTHTQTHTPHTLTHTHSRVVVETVTASGASQFCKYTQLKQQLVRRLARVVSDAGLQSISIAGLLDCLFFFFFSSLSLSLFVWDRLRMRTLRIFSALLDFKAERAAA